VFESIAALLLALLAAVALINAANGTLVSWLKAKFLHVTPSSSPAAAT
jgi:hypothetical protein